MRLTETKLVEDPLVSNDADSTFLGHRIFCPVRPVGIQGLSFHEWADRGLQNAIVGAIGSVDCLRSGQEMAFYGRHGETETLMRGWGRALTFTLATWHSLEGLLA